MIIHNNKEVGDSPSKDQTLHKLCYCKSVLLLLLISHGDVFLKKQDIRICTIIIPL